MDDYYYGSTEERVTRGLNWLSENAPANWTDQINIDTLDIGDGFNCVLGQIFAPEANGTDHFSGYMYVFHNFLIDTQKLGFCGIGDESDAYLTAEWIGSIVCIRELVSA